MIHHLFDSSGEELGSSVHFRLLPSGAAELCNSVHLSHGPGTKRETFLSQNAINSNFLMDCHSTAQPDTQVQWFPFCGLLKKCFAWIDEVQTKMHQWILTLTSPHFFFTGLCGAPLGKMSQLVWWFHEWIKGLSIIPCQPGYRLDVKFGFDSPWRQEIYLFCTPSRLAPYPAQPPSNGQGLLPLSAKLTTNLHLVSRLSTHRAVLPLSHVFIA
jgi:hypothetical protein